MRLLGKDCQKSILDCSDCNGKFKNVESCNGCNGSCNNASVFAKLNQNYSKGLNTSSVSTIEDCNGCNGSCNNTELVAKLSNLLLTGSKGKTLSDCSGCNGSCTGVNALEKVLEKCGEAEGNSVQVSDCTIPCMAKIE